MTWMIFPVITITVSALWAVTVILLHTVGTESSWKLLTHLFFWSGILVLTVFILGLWGSLGRPPMRTLGETRLWYAYFMPLVGYFTWQHWKLGWVLSFSLLMAVLFLMINVFNPEMHDRALMPALQSPWFVPHVIVYIFAYAILAVSAIVAGCVIWNHNRGILIPSALVMADNLVYIGLSFLTLGLIFGAIWGKEAWGHYWNWDPKEIWALLTWIVYVSYIHLRVHRPAFVLPAMWTLAFAYLVLLVCWFGVNYLPSAQGSVHTY